MFKWSELTHQINKAGYYHDSHKFFMTSPPLPSKGRQETCVTHISVHQFTGGITGERHDITQHTNEDTIPHSISTLYFEAVITLLLEETN
jgi:hypothetical protein